MTLPTVKEQNGLVFYRKPYTNEWFISGTELCRRARYKNPREISSKLYSRNKDFFPESDKDVKEMTLPDGKKYKTIARSLVVPGTTVKGEKMIRVYNKPAAYFLISLMRTKEAKQMTQFIMDAFATLEESLEKTKSKDWIDTREKLKIQRLSATNGIQNHEEYATDCGSKNGHRYYSLYTIETTKAASGLKNPPKGYRNSAPASELMIMALIEGKIDAWIAECIEQKVDYHDVYYKVKDKIHELGTILRNTLIEPKKEIV